MVKEQGVHLKRGGGHTTTQQWDIFFFYNKPLWKDDVSEIMGHFEEEDVSQQSWQWGPSWNGDDESDSFSAAWRLASAPGVTSCQGSRTQSSGCCCWCWTERGEEGRDIDGQDMERGRRSLITLLRLRQGQQEQIPTDRALCLSSFVGRETDLKTDGHIYSFHRL